MPWKIRMPLTWRIGMLFLFGEKKKDILSSLPATKNDHQISLPHNATWRVSPTGLSSSKIFALMWVNKVFPCYLAPSASYSAERIFAPKELCTSTKDTPNTNDSSWMLRIMTILKTHIGTVTVTTSKHQVRKKQQQNLQANFDHAQTNNSLHIASALGSFFPGCLLHCLLSSVVSNLRTRESSWNDGV